MTWTTNDVWKLDLEVDFSMIEKLNGILTYMVVKSYYYKRDANFFKFMKKYNRMPVPENLEEIKEVTKQVNEVY